MERALSQHEVSIILPFVFFFDLPDIQMVCSLGCEMIHSFNQPIATTCLI